MRTNNNCFGLADQIKISEISPGYRFYFLAHQIRFSVFFPARGKDEKTNEQPHVGRTLFARRSVTSL